MRGAAGLAEGRLVGGGGYPFGRGDGGGPREGQGWGETAETRMETVGSPGQRGWTLVNLGRAEWSSRSQREGQGEVCALPAPSLSVAPLSRLWRTRAVPGKCRRPNPQPWLHCCMFWLQLYWYTHLSLLFLIILFFIIAIFNHWPRCNSIITWN